MTIDGKLIPVLRDGVDIVKMILFKKLKAHLSEKYPDEDTAHSGKLTGAIVNTLFGTPNDQEPFRSFVEQHRNRIQEELGGLATQFGDLRTVLTDALRVQFLCDSQEGMENEAPLTQAKDLGILVIDRPVPLPKTFMEMVRRLGVGFNILNPMHLDEEPASKRH